MSQIFSVLEKNGQDHSNLLNLSISLILQFQGEKTAAMYMLKIFKENFHILSKETHRDRAGCSDDQTKVSKVKDLTVGNHLVSETENMLVKKKPKKKIKSTGGNT